MPWNRSVTITLFCALLTGCASTRAPEMTEDGLQRVSDDRFEAVYRLDGSDLGGFEAFTMQPCTVAFRRNWMRDHNRSRPATGNRVDQEWLDRAKATLGEDCDKYFKEALLEEPAYSLVDESERIDGVIIVAPGVVDIDINAPDVRGAANVRSYTTSAGEMTLSLELRDGATGQVLARIIDRREDPELQWLEWTNSVSNRADARRILRRWSERLRAYLDENT